MAARSMATSEQHALPTRVSVLEHGVQELKTGLDGHRGETRAAFSALQQSLERLGNDIASRGNPTNWYGLISSAAATVMIVGAIFGLAEWRVANASTPLYEALKESRATDRRTTEQIVELRVKQAVMEAQSRRVEQEQDARIRSRVESETRAREAPIPLLPMK